MTPEERQLLANLFERVKGAANAQRDTEAEALIADAVRQQPYAPYLLAQTVIVQEEALKAAASRIQELEAQAAEHERARESGPASFLGGLGRNLFGGGQPEARPPQPGRPAGPWGAPRQAEPPPAPGPWSAAAAQQQPQGGGGLFGGGGAPQGGGGGFLRGAMATAAGVAGGALLYQGISSLFNNHHGASGLFGGQAGALGDTSSLGDALNGGGATPAAGSEIAGGDAWSPDVQNASYDDAGGDDFVDDAGGDDGDSWA